MLLILFPYKFTKFYEYLLEVDEFKLKKSKIILRCNQVYGSKKRKFPLKKNNTSYGIFLDCLWYWS